MAMDESYDRMLHVATYSWLYTSLTMLSLEYIFHRVLRKSYFASYIDSASSITRNCMR